MRDAVARIRSMLPPSAEAFAADRTAREVVILNLFVAIQACLDLGLRNLVAHQYGVLDWARVHATAASSDLDALEVYCSTLATRAGPSTL